MNLYFSNEHIQSKWETYAKSHPLYSEYLPERKEDDLNKLAKLLNDDKIKSMTGDKVDEGIESSIGIIFEELLEMIEESKIRKLNS